MDIEDKDVSLLYTGLLNNGFTKENIKYNPITSTLAVKEYYDGKPLGEVIVKREDGTNGLLVKFRLDLYPITVATFIAVLHKEDIEYTLGDCFYYSEEGKFYFN